MTLVEILVVCAILLLLFGIVAAVLRPGLAAWRRAELRSDLQSNALLSLHTLTQAIASSGSASTMIYANEYTDPETSRTFSADALVVASPTADGADLNVEDGTALWQRLCIYYVQTECHELWRAALDLAPSDTGKSMAELLPADVAQSLEAGHGVPRDFGKHRRVGRYLRGLSITRRSLTYRISLETVLSSYTCALESAVTPMLETFGGQSRPTPSPSPSPEP